MGQGMFLAPGSLRPPMQLKQEPQTPQQQQITQQQLQQQHQRYTITGQQQQQVTAALLEGTEPGSIFVQQIYGDEGGKGTAKLLQAHVPHFSIAGGQLELYPHKYAAKKQELQVRMQ